MLQSLVTSKDIFVVLEFDFSFQFPLFLSYLLLVCRYSDEEDLLRFLSKEEVTYVRPLFEGAVEMGKIKKSALRNWVVIS